MKSDLESPESRDDWSSHWDRYAESARASPAQKMRHELALRELVRLGGVNLLIDIGSGQGDFLEKASSSGAAARLAGFELSRTGVEISRTKVPAAAVFQADLFAPPESIRHLSGMADVAVCLDVIEHVDDPVGFLRRARQYLKPDGVLLLSVPGGPMSAFDRYIGHRTHFTKAKTSQTLSNAGFTVERVSLAGFPFFNLYRLVVILVGKRLIALADSKDASSNMGTLAKLAMNALRFLFRFNFRDTPFGWQVFAVARNSAK